MTLFGENDKKGMSLAEDLVKGTKGISEAFGVDRRTAQRWVKAPDFPHKLSGGVYSRSQIQAWLDSRDGKAAPGSRQPESAQQPFLPQEGRGKEREEARLKRITADIKALELKKLEGELISMVEVEKMLAMRAMIYRQGFISLQTLGPEISLRYALPAEASRVIAAMIAQRGREILENVLRALTFSSGRVAAFGSGVVADKVNAQCLKKEGSENE